MNPDENKPETQGADPQQSDIAEKAAEKRNPVFDPTGRIEGLTADETLIFDVRRHPIGLVFLFIQTIFALALSLTLIFVFLPTVTEVFQISGTAATSIASVFALVTISLGVIFLVLASRIYRANQLISSDKNVTQVLQIGLFSRKVSELAMINIEDVTARQKGILPTIFNYGTLTIETAGEQNNFTFIYCPNPNAYAKAVLDARVSFITNHGSKHMPLA